MRLLISELFRDANVSDDANSGLKHFRCDACDRLKQPPSKRKVVVNHAETFNNIVSMDVNFWKIRYAHCDSDCRSKLPRPSGRLSRQVG